MTVVTWRRCACALFVGLSVVVTIASLGWSEDPIELMTPQEVQDYVRQIGGGEVMVVTPAAPVATPCPGVTAVADSGTVAGNTRLTTNTASTTCGDGKECKLKWISKGVPSCEMKGNPPCNDLAECSLCKCTAKQYGITVRRTFCACVPGGDCSKANDIIGLIGAECQKLDFPTPTPTFTATPTPTPKPPQY